MANVFTPGLKVSERAVIRKERKLPLRGEVLPVTGQRLKADDIVARTSLPGKVFPVNAANILSVMPAEVTHVLRKREGDEVAKGELIGESEGFLGFFRSQLASPVEGTIESISKVSGQIMLREKPVEVAIDAYVDGVVEELIPGEGVVVKTVAMQIQGIIGLGGEVKGEIMMLAASPDAMLDAGDFGGQHRGKVVVGGGFLTRAGFERARELGVKAVVTGGFHFDDIRRILGYELGVAITGTEKLGTTLVITEGFGQIGMARRTWELLRSREGQRASVNGATQIRAGVMRPEVIVTWPEGTEAVDERGQEVKGIDVGSLIRCIRYPYFGRIGRVSALPHELQRMASETMVRVLEVEFEGGERAVVPRANVEAIEGS
ncbi:MAG: hypothetical protein GMKNLPBB_00285 [Myxococcota bacterium]|nr:hypothetical protein [Myxococcota bacterium]